MTNITNTINTINTINLFIENYYDSNTTSYYKILTLSNLPNGPLKKYVKMISIKNTSTTRNSNMNYCSYIINKTILNDNSLTLSGSSITNFINNKFNICTIENLSEIFDFLKINNYILNNEYNNIITNINICSIGSSNPIYNIFENKKLIFTFYYNYNNNTSHTSQ